jgi:glycosyltransferase involved in cell wall biosynthesis
MGWLEISLLVRWSLGWFLGSRLLKLRLPASPSSAEPQRHHRPSARVSVLIPARNEAATLPHLLTALARQSLPLLEVIVIDDHSDDDTAAIAAETVPTLGVRVIQPPPLPPRWCGKTWALHHGVEASHGDLLVFLDADTEPAPGFLASLVAVHERWGGLVSVQPYHRTERPYELLSLLFNLVGLMAVPLGPGCGVAFGPAIITSRADYQSSGGHAAVAGRVVEDWFLAHAYEAAGLPVNAWIGHGQIAYRMYPGGLGEMVIGFDKNFATAAGEVRWPWMLTVLLWLSGLFWAAWCLPASLLDWPMVGDASPLPNLLIYTAFALQLLMISRPVGRFGWISLVFPVPVLFFLGVFLLAILNLERGQVVWKGRRVATR